MGVLKSLEGEPKSPVLEQIFIDGLLKTEKFDKNAAQNYIRMMIREASIYESKPGNYNSV